MTEKVLLGFQPNGGFPRWTVNDVNKI